MAMDREKSPANHTSLSSEQLFRQFWKAGSYEAHQSSKAKPQNLQNSMNVHPKFLHSNATSHKWAFGAIAELLDNAIDEIRNGATFVSVDKITNPKDGSSALLFKDDGGGMSPEAMRHCMSFGFTSKNTPSDIGKYGNGFKTSTMRLGADVIVFSRHLHKSIVTQNMGLLSYSFLRKEGYDRIVVPMVHCQYNISTEKFEFLNGREHFMSNLSTLLKWSPYSTESELLEQFNDIGDHGTKVMVYNLWLNDDDIEELDYETDPKDIRLRGDAKQIQPSWNTSNEKHIANRFSSSLRAYLSILYLRLPESFEIVLRGEVVKRHNIADDLKHLKYILYKPQSREKVKVITTIGFLKEAPHVNIHGFNVYYKNRLILPFWQVVGCSSGKGRGVVGVLEANYIEPTHNKQDFEQTLLFENLETRLKLMQCEYWDLHHQLLEYRKRRTPKAKKVRSVSSSPVVTPTSNQNPYPILEHVISINQQEENEEAANLILENQRLHAKCLMYEKEEQLYMIKVEQLTAEISETEINYIRLLGEFNAMETTGPGNVTDRDMFFHSAMLETRSSSFTAV